MSAERTDRIKTLIIGGGQAGLALGYRLKRRGIPFLIVDDRARVGDAWRERWDSLRLFTPARYNGLPGRRFPGPPHYFPTKDEMGDFLERYAADFDLPVRTRVRVDELRRNGRGYVARAGSTRYEAENVVVAMASYQRPWTPPFADALDPAIVQVHSARYRRPDQLRPGRVLLVGAGNSGSEIAMELAPRHDVVMAGRNTGELPFRPRSFPGRHLLVPLVLRVLFPRILAVSNPIGRAARKRILGMGGPLIRVKNRDLERAGVRRAPRMTRVEDGRPVLEDGRVMEVENVVWCTGYRTGFEEWIRLDIHGDHEPRHQGGVVPDHPGLFFLGLHFQRSLASNMIQGATRDSEAIARAIEARVVRERAGSAAEPGTATAIPA